MQPRSLLEEDATDVERALLQAGRADGPRQAATAHLLATMQALAPGQPVAASAGHAGLVRWVKLGLLAVTVGGVATVSSYLARTTGNPPAVAPVIEEKLPVAAPSQALAPDQAAAAPEARADLASAGEEDQRLGAGESQARRRKPSALPRLREIPREASNTPLDRSLGNETRALDRAREALDGHRPSEAMRVLDEYQRSFPQGRLRPESMVLRLAALVQAGRRGAADSLASQLLADQAYQTYASRIRSLLGESKP